MVIPFEPLWSHYKRIIKPKGAIVLFGSQPFTSLLVCSNLEWFRYCWVWNKRKPGNIFVGKIQPLKIHEDVCVFSRFSSCYYPQMTERTRLIRSRNYGTGEAFGGGGKQDVDTEYSELYPKSIIEESNALQIGKNHPTQKPVALMEYLIRTYTNEGETVMDNAAGSFTTGVACLRTNRNFIGIEKEANYFEIGRKRLEDEQGNIESTLFYQAEKPSPPKVVQPTLFAG